MTEIEQQPPPQNGIDLTTEEDESNITRPADIEQDMREMDRRKRVEAIMGSKLFREELERIVDSQIREGGASGILQQLSDIVGVPASRVGSLFKSSNCVLPINDIRGIESMGYAKGEKILRCKLAATFRLLDLYGWTQGLGAQITARLNADQELFLVNPFGLLFHEVTASSLNKVDMQGNVVEQGTTNFGINNNHYILHSVVHSARPDIRCAIYLGCNPVVAVSSLKAGILPLTKDAALLGEIATHPYTGALHEPEEREKLVRNLGPISKVLLLSNHGAVCCGETIEEAFFAAYHIVQACETQLKLLPVGLDNLVLIPEESRKALYDASRRPPEGFEAFKAGDKEKEAVTQDNKEKVLHQKPKWRVGGAEYEALMRMLDNAGFRTGYIYRHPLVKSELPKPKNDVEVPPAVSSLGYLLEEEELYRQGIWKKGEWRKGGDRTKWLNSPNVYQKVEVLETGTPDPKKITKWVADGSPTHSNAVKIEHPLQFVPVGTNPKEFKRLQQQIKDNRRADKISAGPQSHILEGVTWDEANRIKENTVTTAGDHVVLMGAASKGIIQRGYQHNATVYKAPYAKNPFDNVTDDELNEYKKTVEKKKKNIHGEYTDTDFSESEALSSLQTSGAQQKNHTLSQSETEDASEHQVMRIETKQAPKPSQPEVVLSDATDDFLNVERSHAAANKLPPTGRDIRNTEGNLTSVICSHNQEKQEIQENILNDSGDYRKHLKTPYPCTVVGILSNLDSPYINNNNLSCSNFNQKTEFYKVKQQQQPYIFSSETVQQQNEPTEIKIVDDQENGVLYLVDKSNVFNFGKGFEIFDNWQMRNQSSFESINSEALLTNTSENYQYNLSEQLDGNNLGQPVDRQPYRTASHFGFNCPSFREPIHKHYPTKPTSFRPLLKDHSLDAIFASTRYAGNCSNCFNKVLTKKFNSHCQHDQLEARQCINYQDFRSWETSELGCIEDKDRKQKMSELTEYIEDDSYCKCESGVNQAVCYDQQSMTVVEDDSEETPSFFNKILNMNYTNESLNSRYVDSQPDISKIDSLEKRLNELDLDNANEKSVKSGELSEDSFETDSDSKRFLMSRIERINRKEEFIELWEDHVNYFSQRSQRNSICSDDNRSSQIEYSNKVDTTISSITDKNKQISNEKRNKYEVKLAEDTHIGNNSIGPNIYTKQNGEDDLNQEVDEHIVNYSLINNIVSTIISKDIINSELLGESDNENFIPKNLQEEIVSSRKSDDEEYVSSDLISIVSLGEKHDSNKESGNEHFNSNWFIATGNLDEELGSSRKSDNADFGSNKFTAAVDEELATNCESGSKGFDINELNTVEKLEEELGSTRVSSNEDYVIKDLNAVEKLENEFSSNRESDNEEFVLNDVIAGESLEEELGSTRESSNEYFVNDLIAAKSLEDVGSNRESGNEDFVINELNAVAELKEEFDSNRESGNEDFLPNEYNASENLDEELVTKGESSKEDFVIKELNTVEKLEEELGSTRESSEKNFVFNGLIVTKSLEKELGFNRESGNRDFVPYEFIATENLCEELVTNTELVSEVFVINELNTADKIEEELGSNKESVDGHFNFNEYISVKKLDEESCNDVCIPNNLFATKNLEEQIVSDRESENENFVAIGPSAAENLDKEFSSNIKLVKEQLDPNELISAKNLEEKFDSKRELDNKTFVDANTLSDNDDVISSTTFTFVSESQAIAKDLQEMHSDQGSSHTVTIHVEDCANVFPSNELNRNVSVSLTFSNSSSDLEAGADSQKLKCNTDQGTKKSEVNFCKLNTSELAASTEDSCKYDGHVMFDLELSTSEDDSSSDNEKNEASFVTVENQHKCEENTQKSELDLVTESESESESESEDDGRIINNIRKELELKKLNSTSENLLSGDVGDIPSNLLNSIESLIINKIETNKLKTYKDGKIFDKIETTIRNKTTPSKFEDIVFNETRKLSSSTPSSSSSGESPKSKSFALLNLSNVLYYDPKSPPETSGSQFNKSKASSSQKVHKRNPGISNRNTQSKKLEGKHLAADCKGNKKHTVQKQSTQNKNVSSGKSRAGTGLKQKLLKKPNNSTLHKMQRTTYTSPTSKTIRKQETHSETDLKRRQVKNAAINVSHKPYQKRLDFSNRQDSNVNNSTKRNFVIENIKKCAFNSPKRLANDCSKMKENSGNNRQPPGIYSFQSSRESRFASPKFWISLPLSGNTKNETMPREPKTDNVEKIKHSLSKREQLAKERSINRLKRKAEEKSTLESKCKKNPNLNSQIDQLGTEIRELDDGMKRFKNKTDLCFETVLKAAKSMNEVIEYQNEIEQSHQHLRDNIIAERAQQEICLQLLTSAISEEDD